MPGAAALAIGDPIPGIDIVVKCLGCTPPFHGIPVPTGANGAYQFKGLAPGNYDLSVAGQRVQTITVDNKGTISGVLSSDSGKASITFNGQVGVVPKLPSAPVVTSRSNKKTGIAVRGLQWRWPCRDAHRPTQNG
ncbi:carboxypeptidase-like regulatory domain-containing protein [Polaromonas sp. P1(28)-13]|nr:carboxypeptidase-like regulatory domain-containing protein [Polaromonas sp. P1(28)-13]